LRASLRSFMLSSGLFLFLLTDPATSEIYTLSLHDALPIFGAGADGAGVGGPHAGGRADRGQQRHGLPGRLGDHLGIAAAEAQARSEEHTSELQSRENLVCRLLLEKKKKRKRKNNRNQN